MTKIGKTHQYARTLRVAMMVGLLTALVFAAAQSDLYGPDTPENVAWVRVLNAGPQTATAVVGGSELTVEALTASPYVPVEPGTITLQADGASVEAEAGPEQFLTLALLPTGPVLVEDPALVDISRGLISLMNLTSFDSLSLLTDGGDVVVDGVAPGSAQARQVSAAQAALQVNSGGETIAAFEAYAFERAQAYTVVVLEGEDGITVLLLTATTE